MPGPDLQRTGSSNTLDLEYVSLLAYEYFSVFGLEAETLRRALNPCQHGIPFKIWTATSSQARSSASPGCQLASDLSAQGRLEVPPFPCWNSPIDFALWWCECRSWW